MISVIVPVYNVELFIERCLDSILSQTYTDYEILLIDDCGKDNSISIANSYIESKQLYDRIRIIHHSYNRGLSAARNTGILEAKGEYVFFIDSDDTISPDCLESLYDQMSDDIDYVMGNYEQIPTHVVPYNFNNQIIEREALIEKYTDYQLPWNAVNRLLRRRFILDNDLFFMEGILSEDLLWNFLLLSKVHKVVLLNQCTYRYYINQSSIMHTTLNNTKYIYDLLIIADKMKCLASSNKQLRSYYLKIKYDYLPYAVLWHKYPKQIQLSVLKKIYETRQEDMDFFNRSQCIYYHFPIRVIIICKFCFFYSKEFYQLLKTKLTHCF